MKFKKFHKSKYLCIKSDSYMDSFFDYKKNLRVILTKRYCLGEVHRLRGRHIAEMRKKEMMKYAISTVHVQQLFWLLFMMKRLSDGISAVPGAGIFFSFFQS